MDPDPDGAERELCWISLRTAEIDGCAVSLAGVLTGEAARLVRRWVVLLRNAAHGDVTISCDGLHQVDDAGVALLRELVWGLEAQGRAVRFEAVPPDLVQTLERALGDETT